MIAQRMTFTLDAAGHIREALDVLPAAEKRGRCAMFAEHIENLAREWLRWSVIKSERNATAGRWPPNESPSEKLRGRPRAGVVEARASRGEGEHGRSRNVDAHQLVA